MMDELADSLTDDELLAIIGLTVEEFDEIYADDMTADELVAAIEVKRREAPAE